MAVPVSKIIKRIFSYTVLNQFILVVSYPLITRLYSPAEFGDFGSVQTIAIILWSFVTLKMDLLLIVEKNKKEQKILRQYGYNTIFVNSVVCIVLAKCICILGVLVNNSFLFLLSGGLLGAALTALYQFCLADKLSDAKYKKYYFYKIVFTILLILSQFIFAYLPTTKESGLVSAWIFAQLVWIFCFCKKNFSIILHKDALSNYIASIKKYNSKIKHVLLSHLLGNGSNYLPILIIPALFEKDDQGVYFLFYRVVVLPVDLICNTLSQTIITQKSYLKEENVKTIKKTIIRYVKYVALIGVFVIATLLKFEKKIVEYLFGNQWNVEIQLLTFITLTGLFKLGSGPFSQFLNLNKNYKTQFNWELFRFNLCIIVFVISFLYKINFEVTIIMYLQINSIMYIIQGLLNYKELDRI